MQSATPLTDLNERLGKLERQNRLFRIGGLVALLVVGSLLLIAARPQNTQQAEKFVLVDSSGRTTAVLGVDTDGHPGLSVKDPATGNERAWLGLWGTNEVSLGFFDKDQKERSRIGILTDGTMRLSIFDAAGKNKFWLGQSGISFYGNDDKERAWFGMHTNGQPGVSLYASDMKQRVWMGVTDTDKPAVAIDGPTGKDVVWLGVYNNGRPGVSIYDNNEKERAFMGILSSGRSGMSVSDSSGTSRTWMGTFGPSADNESGVSFSDSNGKERAWFGVTPGNGPRLVLFNADRKETWSTPTQ